MLPNGPELAVATLAVAATASCAPINPAYAAEEVDKYFADLRPRALITQAGIELGCSACRARARNSRHRTIGFAGGSGWSFHACWRATALRHPTTRSQPTITSPCYCQPPARRPGRRFVPQTHAMICASAFGTVAALALRESRSLLECPAAVSWPRSPRHHDGVFGGGRQRRVYRWF